MLCRSSQLQNGINFFEVLCFPVELGSALEFECLYGDGPELGVVLRDALGIKSPRTAIKRAQTLLQYFKWHQMHFLIGIHGNVQDVWLIWLW